MSQFFTFHVPDDENIESVTFAYTVLNGQATLFVSHDKTDNFPNGEGNGEQISSWSGTIVYKDLPQLNGTYYLGVYAKQHSEYTLRATIQHTSHTTGGFDNPPIKLEEGTPDTYTFKDVNKMAIFKFTVDVPESHKGSLFIQIVPTTGEYNIACDNALTTILTAPRWKTSQKSLWIKPVKVEDDFKRNG